MANDCRQSKPVDFSKFEHKTDCPGNFQTEENYTP